MLGLPLLPLNLFNICLFVVLYLDFLYLFLRAFLQFNPLLVQILNLAGLIKMTMNIIIRYFFRTDELLPPLILERKRLLHPFAILGSLWLQGFDRLVAALQAHVQISRILLV